LVTLIVSQRVWPEKWRKIEQFAGLARRHQKLNLSAA
jgi:hypothetical protein